jgi:hypothetical protein
VSAFAPTLTWEEYQRLPAEQRRRPLTPAEYAALKTPDESEGGAPADFAGPVFPNPNHIRVSSDQDPGGDPTRLPDGVSFQKQNFSGPTPADVSNPPAAQILPAAAVTTGKPIDYDALAAQHGGTAAVDYDALAAAHGGTAAAEEKHEQPTLGQTLTQPTDQTDKDYLSMTGPAGVAAATIHGFNRVADSTKDAIKGTWDSVTQAPQDDHEKTAFNAAGPAGLAIFRMLRGLGHSAADSTKIAGAIHDINQSPDPLGVYAGAAEDTAAQGAGQALTALGTEGAIKAAPKVLDTVTSPTKITAPIRTTVRAVNKALEKAPGTIGTAIGTAAGAATGLPFAAEAGAAVGGIIGKEVLPEISLPGENFGLPKRVTGGEPGSLPGPVEAEASGPSKELPAAFNPPYRPPTGTADNPATGPRTIVRDPETGRPEFSDVVAKQAAAKATPTKPAEVKAAISAPLDRALGNEPVIKPTVNIKPGVKIRNQITKSATPLPEGFTPADSELLKGYKYDPETERLDAVLNSGEHYAHQGITPDQFAKFEAADSQGRAWNALRNGPGVSRIEKNFGPSKPGTMRSPTTGEIIPKSKAGMETTRTVEIDPETGRPEFSDVIEGKKNAATARTEEPKTAATDEDLTSLLDQSLDQAKVGKGGVMTTADPADLSKRWGVDPESLASGREQTRGMSPEQTEEYIAKLADSYRKGRAVEPVMETRDAENNIVGVDGRARAIAAERAGIKRIRIMIRRVEQAAAESQEK